MKGKLLFGTGIAAGYILGSRSGRAAYEKLKARAAALWESKPVQDRVSAATEAVKDKAPEVSEQLTEAAHRAGTVISSAVHRDAAMKGTTSGARPETVSPVTPDVLSDPALNDQAGQDWSDEGGATPAGAATNVDPDKVP
ncbi:hypothetical protein [Pseudarthrobacter sp. S9]|uniref:hypothetical protein n=1 Tax=Pseudarthrobacter sp. S9 TaxID=3418421 RepID=UPI003D079549